MDEVVPTVATPEDPRVEHHPLADGGNDRGRVVERDVRSHPELTIHGNGAVLEAGNACALLDREVRVLGAVNHAARPQPSLPAVLRVPQYPVVRLLPDRL